MAFFEEFVGRGAFFSFFPLQQIKSIRIPFFEMRYLSSKISCQEKRDGLSVLKNQSSSLSQIGEINENPLFLLMDTREVISGSELPIQLFESDMQVKTDTPATNFVKRDFFWDGGGWVSLLYFQLNICFVMKDDR